MMFPLIDLPTWLMIALNIILWPFFHIVISIFTANMNETFFKKDTVVIPVKPNEKHQRFYEQWLFIRGWKKFIPDGATIFKFGFRKKNLEGSGQAYIEKFILETRRAEFSHILQMLPMMVFFVFNTWEIAMIMVVYALVFNLPLIVLQRYNRIRFMRLLQKN